MPTETKYDHDKYMVEYHAAKNITASISTSGMSQELYSKALTLDLKYEWAKLIITMTGMLQILHFKIIKTAQ